MSTFEKMLGAESGTRHRDKNGRVIKSPVGATGIAQVMPATGPEAARDAGLKWDPVRFEQDSDYNEALGRAYHQKLIRTFKGDERKAVAAYNAGPGRVAKAVSRRGGSWEDDLPAETKNYLRKVTGSGTGASTPRAKHSQQVGRTSVTTVALKDVSFEDVWSSKPDELFTGSRRPLDRAPKVASPSAKDRVTAAIVGKDGINIAPSDSRSASTGLDGDNAAVHKWDNDARDKNSYGHMDRFAAGMADTLVGRLIDHIGEKDPEFDSAWMASNRGKWADIESFGQDQQEVDMLRDAGSQEHLAMIQTDILERRQRNKIIDSSDHGTLVRMGTGILDPVGWAAGFGVGKALQVGGMGARALAAAGRPMAAVASGAGEGVIGNVAVTAMLDADGEHLGAADYGMSALTGLLIGGAMGGVVAKFGGPPAEAPAPAPASVAGDTVEEAAAIATPARRVGTMNMDHEDYGMASVSQAVTRAKAVRQQRTAVATQELGPDATPEQINARVEETANAEYKAQLEYALAEVPADQRLMVAEEILTADEAFKAKVMDSNDLASIADITEREMVAEAIARATRIDGATVIDKKVLKTILSKVGQESTAGRMLQSESPVMRGIALTLLENAQGAGGRRRTAAIALTQRERIYNEQFSGWDTLQETFRKQEGGSRIGDFINGTHRNEFNRRVFAEVDRRQVQGPGLVSEASQVVKEAADLFENGMDIMRIDQQHVQVVGAARLGNNSVGYAPHRLDPRALMALTAGQRKQVRSVLAGQFEHNLGMDAEFAETLGAKYLERAIRGGNGSYQVPFNLHSPEAGQIVRDVLEGMNLGHDEVEKLMGKFSRGGAGHTKQRLKLDLSADIGDGKTLMDIFVTDIPALYRSYARRVAGEVALAQHGVMGKKGLNILRVAAESTGATADELKSFDQIAAEFLNTSFGSHNHAWMDNVRIATSASRLGGMGFTQFAEFGNAIPALGVKAMMEGIASMPRLRAEVAAFATGKGQPNPILQSIDTLGGQGGLEDYHLTRMYDVKDNNVELYNGESMSVATRALRGAAHGNMVLSGHRMVLATQVRAMSEQIVRKAVRLAKSGANDAALDDMGINAELRAAIKADLGEIATFDGKGELASLDLMKGKALTPGMVNELVQAVERGSSQIIQKTYVGETGAWAHDGFLKLLFQFRTFSIISVEKQWGRNLHNYGALKSAMYLAGAASFAVPIHLARVQGKMIGLGEAERKKYWEDNANPLALTRATMNYASASGLLGDITDVGASAMSNYGGDFGERLGGDLNPRGKRADQLVGGVVAPGAGLMQDVYQGVLTGNPKKLIKALPGSNLPYVSPFITALTQKDGTP